MFSLFIITRHRAFWLTTSSAHALIVFFILSTIFQSFKLLAKLMFVWRTHRLVCSKPRLYANDYCMLYTVSNACCTYRRPMSALVHFRTLVTLRRVTVRVRLGLELRLGLVRIRIRVRLGYSIHYTNTIPNPYPGANPG